MAIHRVVPIPDNVDYERQAFQVPGTKRPGQTGMSLFRFFSSGLAILKMKNIFHQLIIRMVCHLPRFPLVFVVLHFIFIVATFGYVDFDTPGSLTTLPEVFDAIYARHYVWQTYAQVDERRRHIGSAIHSLFENGTVGGGELPTVGLWSPNRPGKFLTFGR